MTFLRIDRSNTAGSNGKVRIVLSASCTIFLFGGIGQLFSVVGS